MSCFFEKIAPLSDSSTTPSPQEDASLEEFYYALVKPLITFLLTFKNERSHTHPADNDTASDTRPRALQ